MDATGIGSEEEAIVATMAEPSGSKKRSAEADDTAPRSKRGKYSSMACEQCKKRKMKCITEDSRSSCQRCLSSRTTCVFKPAHQASDLPESDTNRRFEALESTMSSLQQRVDMLQRELVSARGMNAAGPSWSSGLTTATAEVYGSPGISEPQQPLFVASTRPDYSFDVAKTSLQDMGVPAEMPAATSTAKSAEGLPEPASADDPLWALSMQEILRLLHLYEDEVYTVYPFVCIPHLIERVSDHFNTRQRRGSNSRPISKYDIMVLKIAVAIGKVVESLGRNDLSDHLVQSVEVEVFGLSISSAIVYNEISVMASLSIYHFFVDEELLAWRTIGFAARAALEMGIHRRESLIKNFPDKDQQHWTVRLWWCIYVLDRRWSLGMGLPFAIQDADIDPDLPQPDSSAESAEYLQCMIRYARISGKVFQAFPCFASSTKTIPQETMSYLDFQVQNWIADVPPHLRLVHPRAVISKQATEDRTLRRLRALLYLRGNHMRILINRQYVISTSNLRADLPAAQRVVDIAKDSIEVLVHLHATSDFYLRQLAAFNYYLASALAAVFVAVCHEPTKFAEQCRPSFYSAVQLVRTFSAKSSVSRRLWENVIRGLLPGAKKLGLHDEHEDNQCRRADAAVTPGTTTLFGVGDMGREKTSAARNLYSADGSGCSLLDPQAGTGNSSTLATDTWNPGAQGLNGTTPALVLAETPDMSHMTDGLTNWFETFGQANATNDVYNNGTGPSMWHDISDQYNGLFGDQSELSWLFGETMPG